MPISASFIRRVCYPLALWRRSELATLAYQREFERTQWLSKDELHALQWSRLQSLLNYAYQECPFYRQRFDEVGFSPKEIRSLDDFRALPILEKSDLQQHWESMLARNWPRADRIRNQTGGSTGTPITFYLCRDRKCSRAAATLRHNRWAGWELGDRAAVIWGAPRDRPGSDWRSRLRDSLLGEPRWLDAACLTEETMESFRRTLASYRPKVIQAYARAAVVFAQWLEATGRTVPSPHSLITSAEVLEDNDRALLERVFGCEVFNRYGCREVSVLASECEAHQGLHVMAEGLYLELEGVSRPGQLGSVLVTDLLNPAMPLIRYRIGDMASWAEGSCPCGRNLPRLERVAGRTTDFLVGADGRLVSGVFLATYVVAHRPNLGQVRILQDRVGHVVYQLVPGIDYDPLQDGEYLRQATREHLGACATCEIVEVGDLPRAASGKFIFSRSTVAPTLSLAPMTGKMNATKILQ